MRLQAHYDALRTAALPRLAQGQAELDALLLDGATDDRRGITLLARPPAAITATIEDILADFQRLDPAQYYYPAADIHLTILSIISCYHGFTLADIDPEAYRAALRSIVLGCPPFRIRFAGLTASAGGIMVQGFPLDAGLEHLRDALRRYFRGAGLQQSIDQRYSIQTAHSTIIRFRHKLLNPSALLEKLARYERQLIGTFEVASVELVYNDWYQRAAHTVLLGRYPLGGGPPPG